MKLPTPLLLLIATQLDAACAQQFDAPLMPTAIRKMAPDPGEKFFPEYFAFDAAGAAVVARDGGFALDEDGEARIPTANTSATLMSPLRPPFAPHMDQAEWPLAEDGGGIGGRRRGWEMFRRAADALSRLERRQGFACPSDTQACLNIGYPNSCCGLEEKCVIITDTGFGKVGCCPDGETCGGSISACPAGDTLCPVSVGGGCCIAGFSCYGIGCVPSATGPITLTTTSTSMVSAPTPSAVIVTVVITETPISAGTTSTLTQTVTGPSSGTASVSSSNSSSSSERSGGSEPAPAVRPTSLSSSSSSSSSSTQATSSGYCPTGFYACVASAGGGCCQTGRDCSTTSCPPLASTTVVSSGETIVVPLTDIPASATSTCAGGWFLCGADAGPIPGCCPSGYNCGTASCSLVTAGATATVAKELPSIGARAEARLGLALALAMVISGGLAFCAAIS